MKDPFGCIILAAGLGTRFGENKLSAVVGGAPLYLHAMSCVPAEAFDRVCVVSCRAEILNRAQDFGFTPVANNRPEDGVSRSIRLGLNALGPCRGALFLVADQPHLTKESVQKILSAAREHPGFIIVPVRSDGTRGNPCFFPDIYFPELLALRGDKGGKQILRAHKEAVYTLPLPDRELSDIDTKEELERFRTC